MANERKEQQLSNRARIYQLQEALAKLQVAFNQLLVKLEQRDYEVSTYLAAIPVTLAESFPEKFVKDGKPRNIYLEHVERVVQASKKHEDPTSKGVTLTLGDGNG